MIRNDLHVHSIHSACGLHSLAELVQIAAAKGMRGFNLSDHGPASGRSMNYGVMADPRRLPETVEWGGAKVRVWRGIEANLLNIAGDADLPAEMASSFDLVSLGIHAAFQLAGQKDQVRNTEALVNALSRGGVDLVTHPCIAAHPVDVSAVVDAAVGFGVMLEVNNTALRLGKTDVPRLERMIELAVDRGALLVECSDGHVYTEVGENERIEEVLGRLGLDPGEVFLNRDDAALDAHIARRKVQRGAN